jgi:TRAP-type C4-dicarboxylate transport system permease small subunit
VDHVAAAAEEPRGLLERLDAVVVGCLGLAALALASVNVLLRSVAPQLAIEWADEVQVYLVVWAVCISFAAITAANRHIRADLFVGLLPQGLQRLLGIFNDALGLFISAVLAWFGFLVAYETWDFGDVSTTTLRFPLWIYAAALPCGMGLMALRYAIRLAHRLGFGGRRA